MSQTIETEIERFTVFMDQSHPHLNVTRLCDYGFVVKPKQGAVLRPRDKRFALTLMGITHGNEWAGSAVLNGILSHLAAGTVRLRSPVAFIFGNPWAARSNKRFLERDLNRSFAKQDPEALEEKRARDLEAILGDTAYVVDFHQTIRRCERPFFIFPFTRGSFEFARDMAPRLSIVTHWGKPFSTEGMCTDEFANSRGGTGVSIELGQNGFDPYQIAVGIDAGLWAISTAESHIEGEGGLACRRVGEGEQGEIFTWAEIVAWPDKGEVELDEGWDNFRLVAKGQRLGVVGGDVIKAGADGRMLFPKYLTVEEQRVLMSRPRELCRIMKRIEVGELPEV